MAGKKKAPQERNDYIPEKIDKHIFYGIQLDDEQEIFANAIWNPDNDIVFCDARAGSGKAQPLDTVIPTPNGSRLLGDIRVGDMVFDANGEPTRVLGVYRQGKQRAYKVSLSDGRSTICAGEHLWSYYPSSGVCHGKKITETLNSMMQRQIRGGSTKSANGYAIPLNLPVKYTEKDLPIHPYVVGAFIGDGCCTERHLAISSQDDEIPKRIAHLIGAECRRRSDKNYTWDFILTDYTKEQCIEKFKCRKDVTKWQTSWLFNEIPELLADCGNKRIPKVYLEGSIEQRYELLMGLFDTDGSIVRSGSKYSIRYSSINKELIDDIVLLINSLGYTATVHERFRKEKGKFEYDLHVRVPNTDKYKFFHLNRKKQIAMKPMRCDNYHKYDRIQITSIEDLEYDCEMVCIYVDNPEHLYLTNNYIVTHNTTIATGVANMLVSYKLFDSIVYIMSPYGERKQGWLPGTITEKSSVYFEAFYQALINCDVNPITAINTESMVNQKNGTGYITCITDTFLRGTNLDNAVVIIDEAQNYTVAQLKKVLTRVGSKAKVIVIGHDLQCDLDFPETSGFTKYIEHFKDQERTAVCTLVNNHRGWISRHADELPEV